MIHRELCKKFKFDHTTKWYVYKPEFDEENETQKILWDFEILTDHLILARTTDLMIIDKIKENLPYSVFRSPTRPQNKNPRKQKKRTST